VDGTTGLVGAEADQFGSDPRRVPVYDLGGDERPPPVGGGALPQDRDGDGTYEDVTGDGILSIRDVATFLEGLDESIVRSNPDAFDFNGDGSVSILDVAELLDRL
jgi:hypothetical protein